MKLSTKSASKMSPDRILRRLLPSDGARSDARRHNPHRYGQYPFPGALDLRFAGRRAMGPRENSID